MQTTINTITCILPFFLLQQGLPQKQKKKPVEPKKFELRPYQQELAERVLRGDNCVIIAPTGSGKTHVAIRIIQVCFVKSLDMLDLYQQGNTSRHHS